ncbi:MAG TPA: hypothetical protein PLO37_11395 [Candidatus Hydrogenedentes bacterium]|nr:hypothetical protein [Candidatus Hydrogenedentota bacterium]HPG67444.1 hypothetical protein [Candidatus Hydrogenedentota bacterium]
MKDSHVVGELSAYIDGESRDPERIARHIEACPECRARLDAMQGLSECIRDLPAPEVHPAFATRVLASIEAEPARQRSAWRTRLVPAASLAILALVVAVAALRYGREATQEPSGNMAAASALPLLDDSVLITELERRADAGEILPELDESGWYETGSEDEDWMAVLAEAEWFDVLALAVESNEDLEAALGSLDAAAAQALKELLSDYVQREWST